MNVIQNDRAPIEPSQAIGLGNFFHVTSELFRRATEEVRSQLFA